MNLNDFKKISDYIWEVPKSFRADMRAPARVYATREMLEDILDEKAVEQLVNVATLPGVEKYALAMPDIHQGYGFPIGGVAAIRTKDGVISPGGVGYDINCLHQDSEVSIEFGAFVKIKDVEKKWDKFNYSHLLKNKKQSSFCSARYFMKKREDKEIYIIKTKSGAELKVTGDHPIFNPKKGMVKTELLKDGDEVILHPFKGVEYEEPKDDFILTEDYFIQFAKKVGVNEKGNALKQILNYLKKTNIFPLKYSSWQLPYILKIMGVVLGDGSITAFKSGGLNVSFYGRKEDLEDIRKDILKIGFSASPTHSRPRENKISTYYKTYSFKTVEESFRVNSSAFSLLLGALGSPVGNKTYQNFNLPDWFLGLKLWQKRLFIASFFGAEMSSPSTLNGFNFYCPQLNLNKSLDCTESGIEFLNNLKSVLSEFGVSSSDVVEVDGNQTRGKTKSFRLQVKSNPENLIKFFKTIGYEYHKEKKHRASAAVTYLMLKEREVLKRKSARKEMRDLYSSGIVAREIKSHFLGAPYFCAERFIEKSLWSKGREEPRISFSFISFEDFLKKHSYGKNGFVKDEIFEIKKEPYSGLVYDFTMNDKNHNFIANSFVVSNCGVRLLTSAYHTREIEEKLASLASQIQRDVPSGVGRGGDVILTEKDMDDVLERGVNWALEKGFAEREDLEVLEENGCYKGADASLVSKRAKQRGRDQLGTIGSGNHFLEIQEVVEVYDDGIAKQFGLFLGQITVMIHTGSRGLGHQTCTDYVQLMDRVIENYGITLPDRELACAPFQSKEGQEYFHAMAASANFAWTNRQVITYKIRKAWERILGGGEKNRLTVLYDVAHNIAKLEKHGDKEYIVHRKGATRAFGPGHSDLPEKYNKTGQPVLIPGSMGTYSYILAGMKESAELAFGSACHGAGRRMSRARAKKSLSYDKLKEELQKYGVIVRSGSRGGLLEEAPEAYKDIEKVVDVTHNAGIAKKIVKLKPLAVIKG